ncbi:uncharacterized protein LOC117649977 [Thrips palmi]|uniref:Uncharacterized protein LOC117649977 n=1 Tax=Thrips palmi TaxID=161013 RepID=A0A6P8ZVA2_THRPL|nr:uncharacterized protein LOC117649977 [Thrips palmi]
MRLEGLDKRMELVYPEYVFLPSDCSLDLHHPATGLGDFAMDCWAVKRLVIPVTFLRRMLIAAEDSAALLLQGLQGMGALMVTEEIELVDVTDPGEGPLSRRPLPTLESRPEPGCICQGIPPAGHPRHLPPKDANCRGGFCRPVAPGASGDGCPHGVGRDRVGRRDGPRGGPIVTSTTTHLGVKTGTRMHLSRNPTRQPVAHLLLPA